MTDVASAPARADSRVEGWTRIGMRRKLERLAARLTSDLAENVSVEALAREVGLSPSHCIRAFAQAYGMPPHRFRMHARAAHAAKLLRQGMLPVDAAYECGFVDQSHLNRWFKAVHGLTPGQYRRRHARHASR